MNIAHLKSFIWLRYRLRRNQMNRSGTINRIFHVLWYVMLGMAGAMMMVGALALGLFGMPEIPPLGRMLVWDGLIVAFLFMKAIAVLIDIQRSDPLTLERFLHLPVSPVGAFAINYVSSLFEATFLMFAALGLGLAVGQSISMGPIHLLMLLPLLAFLFAVSAIQYQFQGWLALLMANPRKRRTVIVFFTMGFILVAQTPNLINIFIPKNFDSASPTLPSPVMVTSPIVVPSSSVSPTIPLPTAVPVPKMTGPTVPIAASTAPAQLPTVAVRAENRFWADADAPIRWSNSLLPPGWLAYGAAAISWGDFLPFGLSILGYTAIGLFCLSRAYRSTLKYYRGEFDTGSATTKSDAKASTRKPIMEWNWPYVSEQVSAVASNSLQSLLRAPEAKMILVVPIVLAVVFGGMLISFKVVPPAILRPIMAVGCVAITLFGGLQIAGNMFGYDRTGFRAFVLSPLPRWTILAGKNLALAPFLLGIAGLLALVIVCVYPMRIDHYPAMLFTIVSLHLVYCLLGNAMSIIAPVPMAPGGMKPSEVKLKPIVLQLVFGMLFPLCVGLLLIPFGVEALLDARDIRGWPVGLAGSFLIAAGIVLLYRTAIVSQGKWLARSEKGILLAVTSKAE